MPHTFVQTGVLYREDNLTQLAQFPDECVDLVYLDPPFFSNRHYEVIWGDEAEVRSFEDRWQGGIQVYVDWMRDRMFEIRRVLRSTGSIYLHCDWHASHYLKQMMDDVFGYTNFRNEIVWHYSGWNKRMARHFERRHDVILFYGRSTAQRFNGFTIPWESKEQYLKVRKQKLFMDGDREYVMSDGGGGKRVRRYLDEAMSYGRPIDDVWNIDKLNNSSREALGYPTQKPEALLERIILASSEEGDVVLDPFCGCGTTVAVAERLGRQWIGIDISPTAVNLMKKRLVKQSHGQCKPKLVGMPVTVEELRALKPFEFQNWVIERVHGIHAPRKSGDMGIDGYSFMEHDPIQVKQTENVGRNAVDNFETAIERAGKTKGYIVGFRFTKGAREEVARARWSRSLDIKLVEVKRLLEPDDDRPAPLFPMPATVIDLPLTPPRAPQNMPSAEDLIASDQADIG